LNLFFFKQCFCCDRRAKKEAAEAKQAEQLPQLQQQKRSDAMRRNASDLYSLKQG
jgi:hypothetical protein